MSTAELGGYAVTSLHLHMPSWGLWWADVEVDAAAELSGAVTLAVAGLSLSGAVVSGGPWNERSRYRVAAGAGRWGAPVAARSYATDAGVRIATVIGDAAADCGESFDASTASGTVGASWTREAGPASRSLSLLAPQAWHVGADGVTRLGAWAETAWTGDATRVDDDAASGTIVLAADDLRELVPGVVVDGLSALDVTHTITDATLRTTLWGATRSTTSRLSSAMLRIVEALRAEARFRGLWSYRVVAQHGERLDLQVERGASGMPDLQRVRVRPGLPGCRADHTLGSIVLVAFANADPSRPVVVAFDDADASGFAPDRLDLVGEDDTIFSPLDAIGRVVRYGDPITFGPPGPGQVAWVAFGGSPTVSRVRS